MLRTHTHTLLLFKRYTTIKTSDLYTILIFSHSSLERKLQRLHYLEVYSYLFSFTIFIVNVGQDKIDPAHSIAEEHRVFAVLLFVDLLGDQSR